MEDQGRADPAKAHIPRSTRDSVFSRRCPLPKPNEKLRKIILLLITWGVLLGFFIGYENYFVAGQKEFLIDREFRSLSRLSEQLTAEFDRARFSVSSLAKIVNEAKATAPEAPSNLNCRSKENIRECFDAYSKTYLSEIWDGSVPALPLILCLGDKPENARLQPDNNSSGLGVIVECPQERQPQAGGAQKQNKSDPVLRMDMKPWVQKAFEQAKSSFDDVLVADESGHVLFQQSATGPRIGELDPILATGTDISPKQNVFGFLNPSTPNTSSTKQSDSKSTSEPGTSGGAAGKSAPPGKTGSLSRGSSATRVLPLRFRSRGRPIFCSRSPQQWRWEAASRPRAGHWCSSGCDWPRASNRRATPCLTRC